MPKTEIQVFSTSYKGVGDLARTLTRIANEEGKLLSVLPCPGNPDLILAVTQRKVTIKNEEV